ncbi:hypothetical protein ACFV4T_31455 [Streptomyces sp. NPDC059755]|uniref:hypothetical protein n=1 Tax=Streptomyces sp. NPDC059755 TaxID=3346934 RepID=UPI003648FBB9
MTTTMNRRILAATAALAVALSAPAATAAAGGSGQSVPAPQAYDGDKPLDATQKVSEYASDHPQPQRRPVGAQSRVTAVSAGYGDVVALRDDGRAVEWRVNPYSRNTLPTYTGAKVQTITAGGYHSLALRGDPPTSP